MPTQRKIHHKKKPWAYVNLAPKGTLNGKLSMAKIKLIQKYRNSGNAILAINSVLVVKNGAMISLAAYQFMVKTKAKMMR